MYKVNAISSELYMYIVLPTPIGISQALIFANCGSLKCSITLELNTSLLIFSSFQNILITIKYSHHSNFL